MPSLAGAAPPAAPWACDYLPTPDSLAVNAPACWCRGRRRLPLPHRLARRHANCLSLNLPRRSSSARPAHRPALPQLRRACVLTPACLPSPPPPGRGAWCAGDGRGALWAAGLGQRQPLEGAGHPGARGQHRVPVGLLVPPHGARTAAALLRGRAAILHACMHPRTRALLSRLNPQFSTVCTAAVGCSCGHANACIVRMELRQLDFDALMLNSSDDKVSTAMTTTTTTTSLTAGPAALHGAHERAFQWTAWPARAPAAAALAT